MKKIALISLILLLAAVGYLLLKDKPLQQTAPQGTPSFAWEYEPFMDGEFPKTRISIVATYEDGSIDARAVDVVDGSCNDYEKSGEAIAARSTMIICYAAGLGHYFKVVREETSYAVMRKTFEEASPDYVPPETTFETILRI